MTYITRRVLDEMLLTEAILFLRHNPIAGDIESRQWLAYLNGKNLKGQEFERLLWDDLMTKFKAQVEKAGLLNKKLDELLTNQI